MEKSAKIFVAGHRGMVGTALVNLLIKKGYNNLILKASKELDLRRQSEVETFFQKETPDYIFLIAAKVGGIMANIKYPSEFLYDNLMIQSNVINSAYKHGAKKLFFLGSSCIYPRECPQPMREGYLLTGKFEPTNEGYALAKVTGLKLCEYYNKQYGTNFICLVPPNIYGPGDHFGVESSHVISALIYKFHKSKVNNEKVVEIWGTGNARREFLFVEDAVDACLFFMENYDAKDLPPFINVGTGIDISIKDLAYLIKDVVGFNGDLFFDATKPDGMPRKVMDITKCSQFGWKAKISLEEGIKKTYEWYIKKFS